MRGRKKRMKPEEAIRRLTEYPITDEDLFWKAVDVAVAHIKAWEKVKLDIYELSEYEGDYGYGAYLDIINKRLKEVEES